MTYRVALPSLVLALAALLAASFRPARAARTAGEIAADTVPVWISISVPPFTRRFVPSQSRLPPQIEHVLMLHLDRDPEAVAEAAVDALLATVAWNRPARGAPAGDRYLPYGAAAITAAPLLILIAVRRRRRVRRS